MPTVARILDIAKVSLYLVGNNAAKGVLFGKRLDPRLASMIYCEYKSVNWMYTKDPTNSTLTETANYLLTLLRFATQAGAIIDGGGGGTPITPVPYVRIISPIRITSDDFTSATAWSGANSDNVNVLSSYTLSVFWDDANIFLDEGTQWERTPTGINILEAGFDALTNDYEFHIFISI